MPTRELVTESNSPDRFGFSRRDLLGSPWRWHNSRTKGTTDLRSRTASSISSLAP